jgi:hypothetical protein
MDDLAAVSFSGVTRERLAANWFRPLATRGRVAYNHYNCQGLVCVQSSFRAARAIGEASPRAPRRSSVTSR